MRLRKANTLLIILIVLTQVFFIYTQTYTIKATGSVAVNIETSTTKVTFTGSPIVVDPDIVVTGTETLNKATVTIRNPQSGDELSGTDCTWNAATYTLTCTGSNLTSSQMQTKLRSIQFKNSNGVNANTTARSIDFTLGDAIPFYLPITSEIRYYRYVASPNITWVSAKSAASNTESSSDANYFFGLQGYLATITSAEENANLALKINADAWIGGSDNYQQINEAIGSTYTDQNSTEGKWYWVTGPSSDHYQFTTSNTSTQGYNGFNGKYTNWGSGEPNNSGGEDSIEFRTNENPSLKGLWNDLPSTATRTAYLVEYGGMPNDPILNLTGTKTILVNQYELRYVANGGSGSDRSSSNNYNTAITISDASGFSKLGYDFVAWNTASDGSGTRYDPSDTLNLTSNTILYAQWLKVASSNPARNFSIGDDPVLIDPNFTVDGIQLSSMTIAINNYVPGDELHFTNTSSIEGNFANGYLVLTSKSGSPISSSIFENAVRSVSFSASQSTGERVFSYSVVSNSQVSASFRYNSSNQHFYEIRNIASKTWEESKTIAHGLSYQGKSGYLVTLTTVAEDNIVKELVAEKIGANANVSIWMGFRNYETASSQNGTLEWDGDWRWADGPEEGTAFFSGYGNISGNSQYNSCSSKGISINNQYERWADGEPNGCGSSSALGYGSYWTGAPYGGQSNAGAWDDYTTGTSLNYMIVEYGGMSNDLFTTTSSVNVYALTNTLSISQVNKGLNSAGIKVEMLDSHSTSLKYAAVPAGTTAPSTLEIYNNQFTNGTSFKASGSVVSSGTTTTFTISNLANFYLYDLYAIQVIGTHIINYSPSPKTISASSIRAAYTFNGNLNDVSGNNQTALSKSYKTGSSSTSSFVAGKVSSAYRFDGNTYFKLPNKLISSTVANSTTAFTVSMYFRTNKSGQGLLGYHQNDTVYSTSPGDHIPILNIDYNGKLDARLWINGDLDAKSLNRVDDNQWHKVILSSTGSALEVYLDDVKLTGTTSGAAQHLTMYYNTLGTAYGSSRFTSTNMTNGWWDPFVGDIDEFIVYDSGLTAADVIEASNDIALTYVLNDGINGEGALSLYSKNSTDPYTLPIPSKDNHTFLGWYLNADFSGSVQTAVPVGTNSAKTYYAKWELDSRTVHFVTNGGSSVSDIEVSYGHTLSLPSSPTKTGNAFVGWYKDTLLVQPFDAANEPINVNKTLYAKWSTASYTVQFDSNGGDFVAPIIATYNSSINQPISPSKVGYTFSGWYKTEGQNGVLSDSYNFNTDTIQASQTLHAKWTRNSYSIQFEENGGSDVADQSTLYLGSIVKPTNPTKAGLIFKGWYTNVALTIPYDFEAMQVTQATKLYAKWAPFYPFDFDSNYGTYVVGQTVLNNGYANLPTQPSRTGYTFIAWNTSNSSNIIFDFNSPFSQNTTVYAQWSANNYSVHFDSNTSTDVSDQSVAYGQTASEPASLTRTGYTFLGWSTEPDSLVAWDFTLNRIYGETTLYGIWMANAYTVTFKDAQGTVISTQTVTNTTPIPQPNKPLLNGYRFTHWSSSYSEVNGSVFINPVFSEIPVLITNSNSSIIPTISNVFDAVEFTPVELENDVSVKLLFNQINASNVDVDDKRIFDAKAQEILPSGTLSSLFLDIQLFKVVNTTEEQLEELSHPVTLRFEVPLEYRNRFFELVRVHTDSVTQQTVAEVLDYTYTSSDHSIEFETDRFSTYGLTLSSSSPYRIDTSINSNSSNSIETSQTVNSTISITTKKPTTTVATPPETTPTDIKSPEEVKPNNPEPSTSPDTSELVEHNVGYWIYYVLGILVLGLIFLFILWRQKTIDNQ